MQLALALISLAFFSQVVAGGCITTTAASTYTTTITTEVFTFSRGKKLGVDHTIKDNMLVVSHTTYLCFVTPTSTSTSTATSTTTAFSMPKCTSTGDLKNVTVQLPAKLADYLKQLNVSELKSVGGFFIDAYTLIWWTYRIVVGLAIAVVGLLVLWTSFIGRQAWQARQVAF